MAVFVRVHKHPCSSWGIGKLIAEDEPFSTISWFDSPLTEPRIETVPSELIGPVVLEPQTRVYWLDPNTGVWHVGRIRDADDMLAEVRFANRRDRVLSLREFEVRWDHPIEDPTTFLAAQINESPHFSQARSRFSRALMRQRGACSGMPAFMSSIIDLEQHQYEVVKRVLQDPTQRYLLADEVGLGKTIEAGVIIRQYVLDHPKSHHILVIAPAALVVQWRRELRTRFLLGDLLDDTLHVLALNTAPQTLTNKISRSGLVVIDEAHHLSRDPELYQQLREPLIAVRRLLLLSATPALHNERGFLEMLHLLDPHSFKLEDEAAFRKRIVNRQALAESVAGLIPENLLQIEDYLDDLQGRFPDDSLLTDLTETLRPIVFELPEESDPTFVEALTKLRAHLGETYRLDRRILRNRRSELSFLTPQRDGVSRIFYSSPKIARMIEAVDAWRRLFADAVYESPRDSFFECSRAWFQSLLQATGEVSNKIEDLLRDRLAYLQDKPSALALERDSLGEIRACLEEWVSDHARFETLLDVVVRQLKGKAKIIVFCSDTEVADWVAETVRENLEMPVERHTPSVDPEEDYEQQAWEQFLSQESHRILVCDAMAEEGLNLQGGDKVVIHFDLPMSPNRIEQRLGRTDRYGSGNPIPSITLCCSDDPYAVAWLSYLDEGLQLFDRSVASLQYLIEDEMEALSTELLLQGVEALDDLKERTSGPDGTAHRELRRIGDQDALDALTLPEEADDFEKLTDVDSDWGEIAESLEGWLIDTLQVEVESATGSPAMPFGFGRFRLCFSYREKKQNTLIPLQKILSALLQVLDTDAPGAHSKLLKTAWFTCRRGATKGSPGYSEGVHLVRLGDVLVDRIQQITSLDDRGRAAAMWRHHREHNLRSEGPADLFLRIDFLVEADVLRALSELGLSGNPDVVTAVSRRADSLFPPFYKTIWLNEEASRVTDTQLLAQLEAPYRKAPNEGPYQDWNVNSERWPVVRKAGISAVEVWADWVPEARKRAELRLREETSLEELSNQASLDCKELAENRFAQLRARLSSTDPDGAEDTMQLIEHEETIAEALNDAILKPRITVGTIEAVFLSPHPLPGLETPHG